jgi:DNA mismatch repair protein MutH
MSGGVSDMDDKPINFETETDPDKIIAAAKRDLKGRTFSEIFNANLETLQKLYPARDISQLKQSYSNKTHKGGLGDLIESAYFGIKNNNDQKPDLESSGIEIKVTPYKKTTKKRYTSKERLVITKINYNQPVEKDFYKSHVWIKIRLIILVFYESIKDIIDQLNHLIRFVYLYKPPAVDLEIIKNDYDTIVSMIEKGKADELSESLTCYLAACTKGATTLKSMQAQYYAPGVLAKGRAFALKSSYMNVVLNYAQEDDKKSIQPVAETIIKDISQLKEKTFEEVLMERIDAYLGLSAKQLCERFNLSEKEKKSKHLYAMLSYRMLGVRSNAAEEFTKANIKLKTIRIEENGTIKESMSFPAFEFSDILNQEFEDSAVYEYFAETTYLFVLFRKHGGEYVVAGSKLWSMPVKDLYEVEKVYNETKNIIKNGVILTRQGMRVYNNFPGSSFNPVSHVRPHAPLTYYEPAVSGLSGSGTRKDASRLPNGQWMPKQCFWLNSEYLRKILGDFCK